MSAIINKFNLIDEFDELTSMTPGAEKESLSDYCKDISSMIEKNIGVVFRNKGKLHAAVVMSSIFAAAKSTIRIFAGDLNGDVSGISIWQKSIKYSFDKHPELIIEAIFENMPSTNSIGYNTLLKLREQAPGRVNLYKFNEISVGFFKKNLFDNVFHFTTGDDNMYRVETNTQDYTAICNIDSPETTSTLNTFFSIIKAKSTLIA